MKLPPELAVLEALCSRRGEKTISELERETGLPRTSLNRTLRILMESGYACRIRRGIYGAGTAALSLASGIFESAFSARFVPILDRLRDRTGLNAELYSITPSGPLFIRWSGGRSMFNVRMYQGHQIRSVNNPAALPFHHRYPGSRLWGRERENCFNDGLPVEDALREYTETGFYFEKGRVLPELARIIAASGNPDFCFGLSGLISEFPEDPEILKAQIKEVLDENHFSGNGLPQQTLS